MSEDRKIGPMDKVNILMHEYDAARTEITEKSGFGFQLVAICAAIAAWLGSGIHPWFWVWLFVTVIIVGLCSWRILIDIYTAAKRLREIEVLVDELTGESYLLQWERRWGTMKECAWLERYSSPRPLPKKLNSHAE
jgi:hypothetical protein